MKFISKFLYAHNSLSLFFTGEITVKEKERASRVTFRRAIIKTRPRIIKDHIVARV